MPFVQHASHHIGVWLHSEHFVFCFFAWHSIRCELLLLCRIAASDHECSAVGMDDALKREPLTAGVRRLLPTRTRFHTKRHQHERPSMTKYKLEYIWLDGYTPVPNMRGKTQIKEFAAFPTLEQLPLWGFDGSSTMQAEGRSSDCVLKPVPVYPDGART